MILAAPPAVGKHGPVPVSDVLPLLTVAAALIAGSKRVPFLPKQPQAGIHRVGVEAPPALGRYDRERWKAGWEELFRTHELVHNRRHTVRIQVSTQGDGAFAVVDVDTLWRRRADGRPFHWRGRSCKGYTKVGGRWLLVLHTGLLDYEATGSGSSGAWAG